MKFKAFHVAVTGALGAIINVVNAPLPVQGTVTAQISNTALPVAGTVSVGNLPAVQAVMLVLKRAP